MQRFRRYRGISGLAETTANRALLILSVDLLRNFGAAQHVKRAAMRTLEANV